MSLIFNYRISYNVSINGKSANFETELVCKFKTTDSQLKIYFKEQLQKVHKVVKLQPEITINRIEFCGYVN